MCAASLRHSLKLSSATPTAGKLINTFVSCLKSVKTNDIAGCSGTSRPKALPNGTLSASSTTAFSPSRSPTASSLKFAQTRDVIASQAFRPDVQKHLIMSRAIYLDIRSQRALGDQSSSSLNGWEKRVACTYCSFPSRYPTLLAFTVGDYRRVSFWFRSLLFLLSIVSDAIMS